MVETRTLTFIKAGLMATLQRNLDTVGTTMGVSTAGRDVYLRGLLVYFQHAWQYVLRLFEAMF